MSGTETPFLQQPNMLRNDIERVLARYTAASVLALVLGSALSAAAFIAIQQKERAAAQQAFRDAVQHQVVAIKRRVEDGTDAVRALGALFSTSEGVTRRQFQTFASTQLSFSPGIQALEWIPRVFSQALAGYENAARQDFPGFQITERGASGQMVPEGRRDEYFPVYYVEPYAGNEPALGFDLASNAARLAALEKARDSGKIIASEPITLVQEKAHQRGFLLFVPVYRSGARPDSVLERRRNLTGFALGVFRASDLVNAAVSPLPADGIEGRLYDDAARGSERVLAHWVDASSASKAQVIEYPQMTATFEIGGRRWSLVFTPLQGRYATATSWWAWSVLMIGVLVTALLVTYLLALRKGARDLFESTSSKLTAETRLSEVLNALDAAVFSVSHETGALCYLSQAAERVLGRPESEFKRNPLLLGQIIHPDDRARVLKARAEALAHPTEAVDYRILRPNGELRWLQETAKAVTDPEHRPLRIDLLARDVTTHKQSESELALKNEVLGKTFENMGQGVSVAKVVNGRPELVAWNRRFAQLLDLPARLLFRTTVPFEDLVRFFAVRGDYGPGDVEEHVRSRLELVARPEPHIIERARPDGTALEIRGSPLPDGGFITIYTDITERNAAQLSMQREAQRYKALMDTAIDGIHILDAKGRLVDANPAFLRMLGRPREEAIGLQVSDWDAARSHEELQARIKELLRHRDARIFETKHRRKDGSVFDVEISATAVDISGERYLYAASRDITERKNAERAAEEANNLLREAVASMSGGFVIYDRDDRLVLCNQAYREMYRESADLLVPGNNFKDIIRKGAERGQYKEALDHVDGWVEERLRRHQDPDGSPIEQELNDGRWVMIAERRTPNNFIAGSRIDITALKRTERALRESEERFRTLTELSSDWIYELDENHRFTSLGMESGDKTALRPPGFVARTPWELPGTNLTEAQWSTFRAVHERHKIYRDFEYSRVSADGIVRWVSVSGVPIFDSAGRFKGYRGIGRDITERKNTENELRRFRLAMDTSVDSIYLTDPIAMRFLDVNAAACLRLGYSREQLLQMGPQDVLGASRDELEREYQKVMSAGEQGDMVERIYQRSDGSRGWTEIHQRALSADGSSLLVTVGRDITDRKRAELALRESEELLRQLATNIPEGYWVRDAKSGELLYVSPTWNRLTGTVAPTGAHYEKLFEALHPDDRERVRHAVRAAPNGGAGVECRIVHVDGRVRWLRSRTFPIRNESGEVYRVAGVAEDITERKAAEERLMKLAHYDHLTDLPNRGYFHDALERGLQQARESAWKLAVLFVDLDRFKAVNDTLGHAAGDQLLRLAAARLLECVRVRDVAARLGGDEFALALPALKSPDDAANIAQKIARAFARPFHLDGQEVFVTASIGLTIYPDDATRSDELLRFADTAMYRAKEEGRNTYRFYEARMNARAAERLELESALRHAIERKEFVLHYQPKIDLGSGAIAGVEALLRWQRPGVGLVPPADFVPLLEDTGLIVPVGEWAIDEVCRQERAWRDEGLAPLRVAVNLASRQFAEDEDRLLGPVERSLRAHGIEPRLIEFEITESALMAHTQKTVRVLERLRKLGIGLSLDDFGTGYSSLAYLKRFPIQTIKIDRSFVHDIASDPDDAAIVLAVIGMAHNLGLRVVAEGVETAEQAKFLRLNRCDEIQGYWFSRPLDAARLAEFLREHEAEHCRA